MALPSPSAAYMDQKTPRKFETMDSTVFMDPRNSTASSVTASHDPSKPTDETSAIAVSLTIRRGRLAIVTAIMILIIGAIVFVFNRGVEIEHFNGSDKNSTQRDKLLNDYNSYSANVATAFSKPIDVFVTIAVQVIALRFMAEQITQPNAGWKLGVATMVCGPGVLYLINNGFNAVNVQLREQDVVPVISIQDLSAEFNTSTVTALATNATATVSELTAGNSITNTALRNVVLERVTKPVPFCTMPSGETIPDTTLEFGFTQRDWQNRVLEAAPPTESLRVVVNPTDASVNKDIYTNRLPMNLTVASDLFVYSIMYSMRLLPWGEVHAFINQTDVLKRNPTLNVSGAVDGKPSGSLAKVLGLLPSDSMGNDEAKQRAFFLDASVAAVKRQLKGSVNVSLSNIGMEFSRVNISSSITFEAVTFEFEVDPSLLADEEFRNGTNRYTTISQEHNCGPARGQCLIPKTLFGEDSLQFDTPAQVQAFASCVNDVGTEELRANVYYRGLPNNFQCAQKSNSSMLVISIGKRLVADALTQNATVLEFSNTPYLAKSSFGDAAITNLRKVYTYTVGRLSWQENDLAQEFGAKCSVPNGCQGLSMPLSSSAGATPQRIVLGSAAKPLALISASTDLNGLLPRLLPLVAVHEPPRHPAYIDDFGTEDSLVEYNVVVGDVLLPHNVGNLTWATNGTFLRGHQCSMTIEDRLSFTLSNHVYMEHSLQPAYTAATFFLFQNGVVKDVIKLSSGHTTLSFQNNVQTIAVLVSIPNQNAWLTAAGCAVLVLGLLAAVIKAVYFTPKDSDPLAAITAPQVIARVMLDDQQFPPMLLHRQVLDKQDSLHPRQIDHFSIAGLSVKHLVDADKLEAVEEDDKRKPGEHVV